MNRIISFSYFKILFLIIISQFVFIANISIISVSSVEKCINSDPSKDISCKTKMILSLTVQNAELEDADYVETTIDQVNDKDGNVQKFSSPIKITFYKTPVEVQYPLTYFQDFNYLPYELSIKTTSTSCKDGMTDSEPTCGWTLIDGKKIEYSQGFCCSCSFLSFSESTKRGTSCSGYFELSASGHCLRYDPLWYSAYKVEKYKIDYIIGINITNTYDNSTISYLELSPKNIISTNEEKTILVKLIGDFLPTDIFPRDLSDKYLCIPSRPKDHLYIKQGKYRWMLIDKTRFTLDGSECDKIGVGFYGFYAQRERCNVEPGSCLKNQLHHLFNEDIERIGKGKNPEYLICFDKNYQYNFHDEGFNSRSFSYNLKGNINTLITLEIDTSIIKFVTNVSSGKIIDIYVNNGFMAMSDDGFMEISITNTGLFTSRFTVTYGCSRNIMSLSSDEISIEPEKIKTYNKSLYTNNDKGTVNQCVIILKNAIGEKLDMKLISFNTSEILINTRDFQNNSNFTTTIVDDNKYLRDEELCSSYFDFLCYFKNHCWTTLSKKIITIGILVVVLLIFKKLYCSCCKPFLKLFCCCCKCCCNCLLGKNKKGESNDDKEMVFC